MKLRKLALRTLCASAAIGIAVIAGSSAVEPQSCMANATSQACVTGQP